jgi:hypothetical protein
MSTQPDGKPPSARLNAHLDRARGTLRAFGVVEALVAAATGAAIGLGLALLLVGWLPFSLVLRAGLWGFIGLFAGGLGGLVLWRRVMSLREPWLVGAALEEAAFRRGVALGDDVRSAVDLLDDSEDERLGRSRALCDAHIRRTCERIESSGAQGSVAGVALGAAVSTLLLTAASVFVAGLVWMLAPDALAARMARLFDDTAAQEALLERAADVLPIVTDLELQLRFPAYMTREDEIISGSSGDVVAPRGTEVQVRGRADRSIKAASLLIGDDEVALAVEGGREVSGAFVVDRAGSYRFRLVQDDGDVELDPVAHRITIAPDEVPKVELEEPAEDATVRLEDEVGLVFSASDDFGITRFSVVVRRQGSGAKPFEKDLLVLQTSPRELRSSGSFTIAETGARAGDRLSVYLEAWDNDTVSGPKAGRSKTRIITVFSEAEHHRKLIELEEKLLDRLVHSLGDELEAPLDAQLRDADKAQQRKTLERQAAVHSGHAETMRLLDQILDQLDLDEMTPQDVKRALRNMRAEIGRPLRDKRDLAKNALTASLNDRPVLSYVWRHLGSKQRALVDKLERHTLYLEDLLNTQRLEEAQRIAEEIRRSQKALKELIEQYKQSGDDETRQQILEEIKRLREQMQQLMKRLSALQRDIPDEYLNHEAFETQNMMKEVKDLDQLIEEGKLDEAAQMLDQMAEQTKKLLEQIEENREEYGGEEYKELREKVERFGQELSALEAAQEELLHRTERQLQAARKEAERRLAGKLDDKLAELREQAQECDDELKALDVDSLYVMEQEDAAFAGARTEDLEAALESGDLEDALDSAASAAASARAAERAVEDRLRGRFASQNPRTQEARERLANARRKLDNIREELEDLVPDPAQMLTPGQRASLAKDAKQQGELEKRARKLRSMMEEIGKEVPIFGPQHGQSVDDAGREMRRAQRSLQGEGMRPARGAQQRALQRLRDLREALQQQQGQQGGSPGSGLPMPLPGGGGGGGEGQPGGDGRGGAKDKVKIPGAEEFRVPDAFRKDILDAMREGAPDEWEGEVRRYYEELVK